ncbi:MAG: hypothetical protein HEQ32_04385 [Vampirovibrio sp.]
MVTFTQNPLNAWLGIRAKREVTKAELVPTKDKDGNLTGDGSLEVK